MAIEITSDTVVKILIRRGTNSERRLTTLTEGEVGYTIDTQRLFVGDGITPGGKSVGSQFLGIVTAKEPANSLAEVGDLIYVTDGIGNDTAQVLYAYTGEGTEKWADIHPKTYVAPSNGINSLEKAPNGKWRVAREVVMGNTLESPTGFSLVYEDESSQALNTLTKIYNRLEFDSRFISMSAMDALTNPRPSFYFGNIENRTLTNNWNATVNINRNLFIDNSSNLSQIRVYASDPSSPGSPSLKTYNGGNFLITGEDGILLSTGSGPGDSEKWGILLDGTTKPNSVVTTFSAISAGSFVSPDHIFEGATLFKSSVYTEADADLTVYGNLSVFGDITYLDTIVTTTSSLSVISYNVDFDTPALFVAQYNSLTPLGQTVARFVEGGYDEPIMSLKETQSVGFFTRQDQYYLNNGNFNFVVSGDCMFGANKNLGQGRFWVDTTNGGTKAQVGSDAQLSLIGYNVLVRSDNSNPGRNNRIILDTNDDLNSESRYVQIQGGLEVTQDIIAFTGSDSRLKDNKKNISNALDLVDQLNGISFEWNEKSGRTGKDYGVIAQEVESILPEIVKTRDNGFKAVKYERLIPLLIEAVKDLNRQLKERK